MGAFTASNGVKITRNPRGLLQASSAQGVDSLWHTHEQALREYFAQEPTPWQEAKPGEVWVLTQGGSEHAYTFTEGCFWPQFRNARPLTEGGLLTVTAGRRIWPEGDES